MWQKAQDTPTEPATETQAVEKVEMPTETEAVTEAAKETQQTETQQTEAQQEEQTAEQPDEEQDNSGENNSSYRYVEKHPMRMENRYTSIPHGSMQIILR